MVEGFQVHLGGGLTLAAGQAAGFGRKLRGLKTTADELPGVRRAADPGYLAGRDATASRSPQWVVRADEEELAMSERRSARFRTTARTAAARTFDRMRPATAPGSAAPAPGCSP